MYDYNNKINEKQRLKSKKQIQRGASDLALLCYNCSHFTDVKCDIEQVEVTCPGHMLGGSAAGVLSWLYLNSHQKDTCVSCVPPVCLSASLATISYLRGQWVCPHFAETLSACGRGVFSGDIRDPFLPSRHGLFFKLSLPAGNL